MASKITIGKLAREVGVSTATLRYYEQQGLVRPAGRSASGYRLYDQSAAGVVRFVQRAQRLGFSLADIRTFLEGVRGGRLPDETVVRTAERRYLEIERQLTELRVLRHELELFLVDFRNRMQGPADRPAATLYDQLVEQVCGEHTHETPHVPTLSWLLDRTRCRLAGLDGEAELEALRGRHMHIWREGDEYRILVPGHDDQVHAALETIARIEANCHAHEEPQLQESDEGCLFIARGDMAFLFAEFFLALENAPALED
jgi:MerR family Zn(II)-responsive transcriptional regulator of zntA